MLSDFDLYYTGGAGNANPLLSLGGLVGAAIPQQTVDWTTTGFGGVTLLESDGFTSNFIFTALKTAYCVLKDPITGAQGGLFYPTADGDYMMYASFESNQPHGWVKVGIVKTAYDSAMSAMTASEENYPIDFTQSIANLLKSVSSTESESGLALYRCAMLVNNTGKTINGDVFIDNHNSPATIAIGLDPVAVGTNPTAATSDGSTPPTGVTFTEPDTENRIDLPQLLDGEKKPIWFRQSVSGLNLLSAEPAYFSLNFQVTET